MTFFVETDIIDKEFSGLFKFALDGSAIKLTTDHYYTPNGNDIHGKGIEPDLEVELDEEAAQEVVIPEEKDNQLQKAVEVVKGK